MTIRLKSLTLVNFGPYRGEQELDLATPEGAPVILIHGENTLGKTQLFSALRWCLYSTFEPQQSHLDASKELPGRLNLLAMRDGETSFEVAIQFEAEGQPYRLTRRANIESGRTDVSADLRIGATVVPAAGIDAEIGRLLHPQISEFFLFDAELLKRFYERLATDRERAFIRESIEAVLGIPALQKAQHDVQDLANDALQKKAKTAKNVDEAERIRTRLKELKDETESVERDRKDITEKLGLAESELRDVRDKLKVVEGLQADVREQEILEASLTDGRRQEESLRTEMKSLLGSGWRSLASIPLSRALAHVQAQNTEVQRHEKKIQDARSRVAVLEDQARGGKCPTCKQTLPPPGPETAEEMGKAKAELAALLEATGGGNLDLDRERRITTLVDTKTIEQYKHKHRSLTELQMLQYERKQTLEGINDRLQGHKAADIRALGMKNKQLEDSIESFHRANEKNEQRAQRVGSEQQKLARQLDKLPGAKPEIVYESAFFRYADDLLKATIDAYRERVRSEVEANARDMFLKLIRDPKGYGGLSIAKDYKIDLLDNHQQPRVTSEGGKQLLALSLIGALKRAAVRGGPVVLDSPLGRLDLEHRANVLQTWIPSLGVQAVLLVQSGELTKEDASKLLGPSIGHAYEIVRPSGDPEYAVVQKVS